MSWCTECVGRQLTGPELGERLILQLGCQERPARRRALSFHRNLQGSSQRKGDREVKFRQTHSLGTGKSHSVLQSAPNVGSGELLPVEM